MSRDLSPPSFNAPLPEPKRSKRDDEAFNKKQKPVCMPCNRTFTTNRAYLRHLRENKAHIGTSSATERPFKCTRESCSEAFVRSYDRKRHEEEQHGNAKKQCSSCGRRVRPKSEHKCSTRKPCHGNYTADMEQHSRNQTSAVLDSKDITLRDCLYSLAQADSSNDKSTERRLDADKFFTKARPPPRSIACGLCAQRIPIDQPNDLYRHLSNHHEGFSKENRCRECQFNFAHKEDLLRHLSPAARGDCGFAFKHTVKCSGHHSPTVEDCDTDRFNFCFRIRLWERSELRAHQSTIDVLVGNLNISSRSHSCHVDKFYSQVDFITRQRWESSPNEPTWYEYESFRAKNLEECGSDAVKIHRVLLFSALKQSRRKIRDREELTSGDGPSWNGLLCHYVYAGAIKQADCLLKIGADANHFDKLGNTPAHYAAMCGSVQMRDLLINASANVDQLSRGSNSNVQTPLSIAVGLGYEDTTERLLEQGAAVNTIRRGFSVLHQAVRAKNVDVVQQLVARGADVHATAVDGETPLHLAALLSHEDGVGLLRTLLSVGADPNAKDDAGRTPVEYVRDVAHVRAFLECANNFDYVERRHFNLEFGVKDPLNESLVNNLLAAGFSVNSTNSQGQTLLHMLFVPGSRSDDCQAMESLIWHGVNVNARDYHGRSALHFAVRSGKTVTSVQRLIRAGADSAVIAGGESVLHLAAQNTKLHDEAGILVRSLLSAGVDVDIQDGVGVTALQRAIYRNSKQYVRALLDAIWEQSAPRGRSFPH